jgi:lipopolysaccharide export system protein LptA
LHRAAVTNTVREPTRITSRTGEVHAKSNISILRTNVHVQDSQMDLNCALLTLENPRLSEGKFLRATAEGNVVIDYIDAQGVTNHATATSAVYTYSTTNSMTNAFLVLRGSPVIITNVNYKLEGDPVTWDRVTDTYKAENNVLTIYQTPTNSLNVLPASTKPPVNAVP